MRTSLSRGVVFAGACAVALTLGIAGASAGPAAGKPRAGKSIIGGNPVSISAWPYQAAIRRAGRSHCGGSVIAPTKILTAAHCVFGFNTANMSVVTGRDRPADTSTGQESLIASAAVHPDYPTSLRHDVAVITLATATPAPAVALATSAQNALATKPGRLLRVAGFGARHPLGGKTSPHLMETFDRVRSPKRCKRVFRPRFTAVAMICAQGSRVYKYKKAPIHRTACFGDSGGPLVTDAFGPAVEVGIVSIGSRVCGYKRAPTVYARVSDARDFIALAAGV
jgi:secreted trypsin-like serine protease